MEHGFSWPSLQPCLGFPGEGLECTEGYALASILCWLWVSENSEYVEPYSEVGMKEDRKQNCLGLHVKPEAMTRDL